MVISFVAMANYEISEGRLVELESFADANDSPIVMVNLLKVRARAEYPAGSPEAPCSGWEAFQRYQDGSAAVRKSSGAELVWRGNVEQLPIAPDLEDWDLVVLVRYPSARAYLDMKSTTEYQSARLHRQAALVDSRLIMCTEE